MRGVWREGVQKEEMQVGWRGRLAGGRGGWLEGAEAGWRGEQGET